VRRETSLRDSFHFPLFHSSTCNSPAEARSTCDDIVDSAPSCPRLSVPAPTSNSSDFDNDMVPPHTTPPPLARLAALPVALPHLHCRDSSTRLVLTYPLHPLPSIAPTAGDTSYAPQRTRSTPQSHSHQLGHIESPSFATVDAAPPPVPMLWYSPYLLHCLTRASLRDSFHLFFAVQPATQPLRRVHLQRHRRRCSITPPTSRCQHPMARLRRRYSTTSSGRCEPTTPTMSFTPSAFLPQPYIFHHHLHLITTFAIIFHLHRRCFCNHHDSSPPLPSTRLHPQPSILLTHHP
jgi:hypothetical protein